MTKQQQENQSSQQMTTPEIHLPVGTHLIVELYGCSEFRFSRKNLEQMAQACGAKSLAYASYQFQPQGQSGVLLLEESHITIHTYPEFGYIAVDVFTCGKEPDPYQAIKVLKALFRPKYILINEIQRGVNV